MTMDHDSTSDSQLLSNKYPVVKINDTTINSTVIISQSNIISSESIANSDSVSEAYKANKNKPSFSPSDLVITSGNHSTIKERDSASEDQVTPAKKNDSTIHSSFASDTLVKNNRNDSKNFYA